MAETLRVSVVLALRHEQPTVELAVEVGTTVAEALGLARLARDWPQWPETAPRLGIFGQWVTGERVLRDGDRVEILRTLVNDPREVRRRRAAAAAGRRSTRRR